jgi:WD40 repeat protein
MNKCIVFWNKVRAVLSPLILLSVLVANRSYPMPLCAALMAGTELNTGHDDALLDCLVVAYRRLLKDVARELITTDDLEAMFRSGNIFRLPEKEHSLMTPLEEGLLKLKGLCDGLGEKDRIRSAFRRELRNLLENRRREQVQRSGSRNEAKGIPIIKRLVDHSDDILAISSNGKFAISQSGRLYVWGTNDGEVLYLLSPDIVPQDPLTAISPNNKWIVAVPSVHDPSPPQIINSPAGAVFSTIASHCGSSQIKGVAFSHDSQTIALAYASDEICLFETATGKQISRFSHRRDMNTALGNRKIIRVFLQFSTDGSRVLWVSNESVSGDRGYWPESHVFVWDIKNTKLLRDQQVQLLNSVSASDELDTILGIDIENRSLIRINSSGETDTIAPINDKLFPSSSFRSAVISNHGDEAVGLTQDGTIRLWNLHTGKLISTYVGQEYLNNQSENFALSHHRRWLGKETREVSSFEKKKTAFWDLDQIFGELSP